MADNKNSQVKKNTAFGASSTSTQKATVQPNKDLLFGKENFKWMLIGIAVMVLGYILMSGGRMPSPEVWDEDVIYSFRRTTLAPIVILIGLGIEVYAIFKK